MNHTTHEALAGRVAARTRRIGTTPLPVAGRRNCFCFAALILLSALAAPTPGLRADPVSADAPPPPAGAAASAPSLSLTPLAAGAGGLLAPAAPRFDFGSRPRGTGHTVEHTFVLRNDNPNVVAIRQLKGLCSCTVGAIEEAAGKPLPFMVKPGGVVHIDVSVDTDALGDGPQDKYLAVAVDGQVRPAAFLEVLGTLTPGTHSAPPPTPGTSAPPFALTDAHQRSWDLASLRGRPVSLFFFCGCTWCHDCAAAWGRLQKSGALGSLNRTGTAGAVARLAETVVVFAGDAAEAASFARETGLDPDQTLLLPDPEMKVTSTYQAGSCPRVFVLDPAGVIRYTNNHANDAPRRGSAQVITMSTLMSLRAMPPT